MEELELWVKLATNFGIWDSHANVKRLVENKVILMDDTLYWSSMSEDVFYSRYEQAYIMISTEILKGVMLPMLRQINERPN